MILTDLYLGSKKFQKKKSFPEAFKKLLEIHSKFTSLVKDKLFFYLQCVAPIRELIKIFEGRKYITISYLIFGIQKSLYLINNIPATNSKGNISETMQEFKNTLIKELEERFPITDLNSLALALDPFVYSQDICADEFNNLQKEWVDIKKESLELPNENYEKRFPKKETDKNEENANLVVPKKKYDTSSLKTSFFLNSPIKTASPYVDELSQYEKIINKSDLFAEYPNGILEFWNKNRIIFPNLSFLAIDLLYQCLLQIVNRLLVYAATS